MNVPEGFEILKIRLNMSKVTVKLISIVFSFFY